MHKFNNLFKNFKSKNFVDKYMHYKSKVCKASIKTAKFISIASITLGVTALGVGRLYRQITFLPKNKEPKNWNNFSYKQKLEYWHSLTNEEQKSLLWKYTPGYVDGLKQHLLGAEFIFSLASDFNKFVMFKALIERLQNGEARNDLIFFLQNINHKEQKNILFPYIANHIAREIPLEKLYLYEGLCNEQQKKLLERFIKDNVKKMTIPGTLTAQQAEADALNVYSSFSDYLGSALGRNFIQKSKLKKLLLKAQEIEKKYMDQGYYVFFHGQTKEHFFNAFITTKLHNHIFLKQSQNPYVHLRCFDYNDTQQTTHIKNINNALQAHQNILNFPCNKYHPYRSDIVFCNSGLYNNIDNTGSCTPHYVALNTNQHSPELSVGDIFARFGQKHVYEKNKKVIDTIRRYFIEDDTFRFFKHEPGVLLVIAVPKHLVDEYVYITESGAPRVSVQVGSSITDKPSVVLKALTKAPRTVEEFNNLEYGFIATQDVIESGPDKGIKIEYLHAKDPEIFQAWEKKIDQILQECTPSATGSPWKNYEKSRSFLNRLLN